MTATSTVWHGQMPDAAAQIRLIDGDNWRIWRDLRLIALAEAADLFGADLAEWQAADAQKWRARLEIPGSYNLIAYLAGTPAAMASGIPAEQVAAVEVISLWVAPAFRRRGLSRLLIQQIERWAAAGGSSEVRLSVMPFNVAAIAAYRRIGFREVPDELGDPIAAGGHELIMAKTLPDASAPTVKAGR